VATHRTSTLPAILCQRAPEQIQTRSESPGATLPFPLRGPKNLDVVPRVHINNFKVLPLNQTCQFWFDKSEHMWAIRWGNSETRNFPIHEPDMKFIYAARLVARIFAVSGEFSQSEPAVTCFQILTCESTFKQTNVSLSPSFCNQHMYIYIYKFILIRYKDWLSQPSIPCSVFT